MNNAMQTTASAAMPMADDRDLAASIGRLVQRARSWLQIVRTTHRNERDAFLDRSVDFCDLEWRVRELDRKWGRSGFHIGGARF